MSRIGKKPVELPSGVTAVVTGQTIEVKGPKGVLSFKATDDVDLKVENVWERRKEFLALNPAGEVPVLVEPGGTALSGSNVISEFLDEIHHV